MRFSDNHRILVYLEIILGIPVRVIDDDCIGSGQVDTQTPGTCTQQEDKAVRLRLGESINGLLS